MHCPNDDKAPGSIEASYLQCRAELIAFFARHTRGRADIDDLVQQVYERLLKYRPRAPVADPRGYLFQTAWNVLASANQAVRKNQARYVSCEASDLAVRAEERRNSWVIEEGGSELAFDEFERVLAQLPGNCQAALLRQRRDGWSYQQIASELRVSVSTVKDYIVKALEHFRAHFRMPGKDRIP